MYVLYVLYVGVQPVYRVYRIQRHVTFGYHSSSHGSIGSIVVRATSTNSSSSALSSCDTWLIRSVTKRVKKWIVEATMRLKTRDEVLHTNPVLT